MIWCKETLAAADWLEKNDVATYVDCFEGVAQEALAALLVHWTSHVEGGWTGTPEELLSDLTETEAYFKCAVERLRDKIKLAHGFVHRTQKGQG